MQNGDCRRTRAHFPTICREQPSVRRFFRPPAPETVRGKFCRSTPICQRGQCRGSGGPACDFKPSEPVYPPRPSVPEQLPRNGVKEG